MKRSDTVLVTGASGFVGSAVVRELVGAGYRVLGLARSEASAKAVKAAGAEVQEGDLYKPETLRAAAAKADAILHLGFNHDFANYKAATDHDFDVIKLFGEVLAGSDRPLVVTSGVAILPKGTVLTESMLPATGAAAHPRASSEFGADAAAAKGVRASVIRLAPSVHGVGDHGFVPMLIKAARDKGESVYVNDGANRWPGVHREDAARLYRLVMEKGAKGGRYHGVAEEGVPFREIARVIGKRANLPVIAKTHAEAESHFGWLTHFAEMDMPASSTHTQNALGWTPTGPGLIADVDQDSYFT